MKLKIYYISFLDTLRSYFRCYYILITDIPSNSIRTSLKSLKLVWFNLYRRVY